MSKKYQVNGSDVVEIEKGGKSFRFSFDRRNDDPTEGVTLTGIFQNGQRLRPSDFSDSEVPFGEAERELIR
jgi:hypothetical protein